MATVLILVTITHFDYKASYNSSINFVSLSVIAVQSHSENVMQFLRTHRSRIKAFFKNNRD